MMVSSKTNRAERVRLVCIGLSASALAATVLTINFATPTEAKTPGSTYCYYGVCHRVKTIDETKALVGVEESLTASHYDDCKHDRYNPCGLTSSGERFHADRPDNTASPIYPDGTMLLVWSPDTGRALVVRVNNAGPYWGDRTLDLSRAAADRLGYEGAGIGKLQVRVIKAPEPEEAVYVENRTYLPVPGDIGRYSSLDAAEQGMAVAMALQASSASPMAPVTAANTFTSHDTEQLVAEAPQALGRATMALAAADTMMTTGSLGLLTQSVRPLHPAVQTVASLDLRRDMKQSKWGEEAAPSEQQSAGVEAKVAAAELPNAEPPKAEVAKVEAPKAEVAAADAAKAEAAKAETAKTEAPKAEPKQLAANDDEDAKPAKKRAERRDEHETPQRSRKAQARYERPSRNERVYERPRLASSEQVFRAAPRERTAEQVMSAGLRAEASSSL
jgi:rare lipoprotein A (peptidoglycan hydrolase)